MSPVRMSKAESAMRAALAFKDAFNRHDTAGITQLFSEDGVLEDFAPAPNGTVYTGKQAISDYWQDFLRQKTNIRMTIEDIFGYGERCILRWKLEWGEDHLRGVDIVTVKDDLICEMLSYAKGFSV